MPQANFGSRTSLPGASLQLLLPVRCRFWFVQNQSTSPLKATFLGQNWGVMSSIVLAAAAYDGAPGGYLDSIGFPYFDEQGVLLSSTDLNAPFGSGASPYGPPTNFIESADGPGTFGP